MGEIISNRGGNRKYIFHQVIEDSWLFFAKIFYCKSLFRQHWVLFKVDSWNLDQMCPQYDIQFRYHHPYLQDCFPNFVKAFANDSLTRIGCIEPKPVTGRCCFVAKLSSENPIKTFSCSIQLLHYCTIEHPVAPIDVMMVSFQFDQNTNFSKDDSHKFFKGRFTHTPPWYIYLCFMVFGFVFFSIAKDRDQWGGSFCERKWKC